MAHALPILHGESALPRYLARAAAMIRADWPLYAGIVAYAVAGLAFMSAADASGGADFGLYLKRWSAALLFALPPGVLLAEGAWIVHRFDRRRRLAAGRAFSPDRIGRLVSGTLLLAGFALFQGTFTSIKNGLSVWRGGFPHDRIQADIDAWLHFGVDPWRPLHAVFGDEALLWAVEWNYGVLWFVLCFGGLVFVCVSPRADAVRIRYLLSFMLAWIVVGNFFAGLFMSAGPMFYEGVTGEPRFAELLALLERTADSPYSAWAYRDYLWTLHESGATGFGSGISAFPSMHVALVAMNALYLWEYDRRLGLAAWAYVAVVLASSVYLGWHYAIDGYAAIALVALIHIAVAKALRARRP